MRPGIATCERPPLTPYHFISQRHSASIVQYTLYRRALHFASCQLPPRQQNLEVLGPYRLHSPCCVPLQCAHCVVNVAEQPGYVLLFVRDAHLWRPGNRGARAGSVVPTAVVRRTCSAGVATIDVVFIPGIGVPNCTLPALPTSSSSRVTRRRHVFGI